MPRFHWGTLQELLTRSWISTAGPEPDYIRSSLASNLSEYTNEWRDRDGVGFPAGRARRPNGGIKLQIGY